MTKAEKQKAHYEKVMAKRIERFSVGGKMTRRQLVKWFNLKDIVHEGTAQEVQASNLRLVQAQTVINSILRSSGLYLRSRNYYSNFYIANKEETKQAVLNHQTKSTMQRVCSEQLEDAMHEQVVAGAWGKYSVTRASSFVSEHAVATAVAGKRTVKRKRKRMELW